MRGFFYFSLRQLQQTTCGPVWTRWVKKLYQITETSLFYYYYYLSRLLYLKGHNKSDKLLTMNMLCWFVRDSMIFLRQTKGIQMRLSKSGDSRKSATFEPKMRDLEKPVTHKPKMLFLHKRTTFEPKHLIRKSLISPDPAIMIRKSRTFVYPAVLFWLLKRVFVEIKIGPRPKLDATCFCEIQWLCVFRFSAYVRIKIHVQYVDAKVPFWRSPAKITIHSKLISVNHFRNSTLLCHWNNEIVRIDQCFAVQFDTARLMYLWASIQSFSIIFFWIYRLIQFHAMPLTANEVVSNYI